MFLSIFSTDSTRGSTQYMSWLQCFNLFCSSHSKWCEWSKTQGSHILLWRHCMPIDKRFDDLYVILSNNQHQISGTVVGIMWAWIMSDRMSACFKGTRAAGTHLFELCRGHRWTRCVWIVGCSEIFEIDGFKETQLVISRFSPKCHSLQVNPMRNKTTVDKLNYRFFLVGALLELSFAWWNHLCLGHQKSSSLRGCIGHLVHPLSWQTCIVVVM